MSGVLWHTNNVTIREGHAQLCYLQYLSSAIGKVIIGFSTTACTQWLKSQSQSQSRVIESYSIEMALSAHQVHAEPFAHLH